MARSGSKAARGNTGSFLAGGQPVRAIPVPAQAESGLLTAPGKDKAVLAIGGRTRDIASIAGTMAAFSASPGQALSASEPSALTFPTAGPSIEDTAPSLQLAANLPAPDMQQPSEPNGSGSTVVQPAIRFQSVLVPSSARPSEITTVGTANPSMPEAAPVPLPKIVPQAILESRSITGQPRSLNQSDAIPSGTVSPGTVTAQDASPTLNKIALENQKQGTPRSQWQIQGGGDQNIQGFATEISTNVGGTVDFKIATDSTDYRIEIYRLGYYGGDGARLVDTIDRQLATAQVQPHPIVDYDLGLIDCGNWSVSASWQIPDDAVSGVYFAKLVREDGTAGENLIPFVVRDDNSTSDIVFQTSDTTWEAYNAWGGASLYWGNVPLDPDDMIAYRPPNCSCGLQAIGRAYAVSYNRPFITDSSPAGGPWDFVFGVEMPAISWLEQNGYDVSYISGIDTTRSGSLLLNHDAFLSVGHDEYWSAEQRANVEAARDSGVNLAFWSGNECYWKVRWESSIDGSGTPYRTMVCYKETWANADIDPSDIATGTWRDPRFSDPGQEPENALTGTMFTVDSYRLDTITIPYDMAQFRFWRDTDIAELQPGETGALVKNLLGYEWDSDVDNGFRPDGLVNLSLSTVSVDTYLYDYGSMVGPKDNVQHSLTMYRAESGALVFGAGTVYWSWGLSSDHPAEQTPTDPNVQQAMVNMFAEMGIQPTTLQASLVLATQTTDHQAPVSTITSPVAGQVFTEGQKVTITGAAQDFGGGLVAGIEVSTDGGETWRKAQGRENWSYSWTALANVTYAIQSRATDDSLNMETPGAGTPVTVTLPSTSSLWTLTAKPDVDIVYDPVDVELGVRFQSSVAGDVTAIRFYKGFYNTGAHFVDLWTASGQLLATAQSTDETDQGWQTVTFSSPVHIAAGTTYVASYHSQGFYSVDSGYFANGYTNGPLTVEANGGVYGYSDTRIFPASNYRGENYWVDVVMQTAANVQPVAADDQGFVATKNIALSLDFASLLANDNDPDGDALTISSVGGATGGTVTLDTQNARVIFTPAADYTGPAQFGYTISDGRGGTASANVGLTVQEGVPDTNTSLFTPSDQPSGALFNDGQPLELGVKFTADNAGTVTGIRFYKAAGDTGTHTAHLWTATGTMLAAATFSNETASGWQTATFASPVSIAAGTTYVASYHSPGGYVGDVNYFTTSHSNGGLTAPSSASSGGNGVYAYGSGGIFPNSSYQATNYWVDVLYEKASGNSAPVAANDQGFTVSMNAPQSIAAALLIANDTDADADPLTVTSVGSASHGAVALDAQAQVITFTPQQDFTGTAGFTYSISDGNGGTSSAQVSLTVTDDSLVQNVFSDSVTPALQYNDAPVELGMKFQADVAGTITGFRFYKAVGETGTHEAHLWSATGSLLASATFTNETASGWQTVALAQPAGIDAGTTYVVSYHSNGRYAATTEFFGSSTESGDLTALSSALSGGNGVYKYGSSGLFPTDTYRDANYYADVLFKPLAAA